MATNLRILSAGTLTDTQGSPTASLGPTAASAKSWLIKSLVVTNMGTASKVLNIKASRLGGTSVQVAPKDMAIPAGASINFGVDVTLMAPATGSADSLNLVATTPGSPGIDYVAYGVESDVTL